MRFGGWDGGGRLGGEVVREYPGRGAFVCLAGEREKEGSNRVWEEVGSRLG